MPKIHISAQPGPQTEFLKSKADIVIYGGAAGGGKTFGLLFDAAKDVGNKYYRGAIFRREHAQITDSGGILDEALKLFSTVAKPSLSPNIKFKFWSGAEIALDGIQYEHSVFKYQGTQLPYIGFDELTHFTEKQFFYMLSRNRSPHGIKSRIRATCNPDPDSFVKKLILWYLDDDGKYPRADRAGKIRYFIRVGNDLLWADHPSELIGYVDDDGDPIVPKSFTFIPAKLSDNKILLDNDPSYKANLNLMDNVDRERLLRGNWAIKPSSGLYYNQGLVKCVSIAPAGLRMARGWDRAATPEEKAKASDADYTASVKLGISDDGVLYMLDATKDRKGAYEVEQMIHNYATQDGEECAIWLYQDPGSAGKYEAEQMVRKLHGFNVNIFSASKGKGKIEMFKPLAAQAQAGNLYLVNGWDHDIFIKDATAFPDGKHDDVIDAGSLAYRGLTEDPVWMI